MSLKSTAFLTASSSETTLQANYIVRCSMTLAITTVSEARAAAMSG